MAYLGNQPISGAIRSQFYSGDNTTTTFNLSYEYGNEASVLVFITGVKQKTDSYAVINGQIVFSTAPPSGTDNVEVIYLGGSVVTKTANASNPLVVNMKPIFGCDVWEHAYYVDYKNRRPDYLKAFLNELANWEFVESQLS